MATGMVLSVAQTLFAALQCKELRDLCSAFRYESQLEELQQTVTTIEAVLLTAESKQQKLTHEGRNWVESLKDAVYDVDDLLDEFRTMALQRQQMSDAKISKKVRRFFSRYNKFLVAFNAKLDIKKIKNKLDSIAKDRRDFGFGDTYEPVKRRVETYSYVREESIIGRETDKEAIVGELLHETNETLSFVTIVGIGGLGKTALAQLVFNDDRIKSAFDLRLWVCVSEDFSMEGILSKMVQNEGLKLEGLQQEVRQKIEGRKYLLVLDDVWNENRDKWLTLRDLLYLGGKGSKVLVTSRSKLVAEVIKKNSMHEIQGLSEYNSWILFKKMVFEYGEEPEDSELVEIGKEIVKKCTNVPLSIRVIGSLLYGQEKSKWLSLKSVNFSRMGEDEGILPILKFSYYHLSPSLKSCFSYCALFPKDYGIEKQLLINLWMAQGCLDSGVQDGQSIEDVGEEYFSILLQRCLLQDIRKSLLFGKVECKMHDLVHDLAQEVAGKEFSLVKSIPIYKKIRHISVDDRSLLLLVQNDNFEKMNKLRTILFLEDYYRGVSKSEVDVTKILLTHGRRLRVLKLSNHDIEAIPKTWSNLVHLRYLHLSNNDMEKLPNSTTKLLNLKVMILDRCQRLKELPKDMGNLINLRILNIRSCKSLTHMPAGLDRLTCLRTLSTFVLGEGSSNQVQMGQLQELKHLLQLTGELTITVRNGYSYDATNAEGGYLVNKSQLKALTIQGGLDNNCCPPEGIIEEGLLEGLKPYCNVERLDIRGYRDMKLPHWAATLGSSLPLLVSLCLDTFPMLQHLPLLSQLQYLKFLTLCKMDSVEYMEDDNNQAVPFTQGSRTAKVRFFQSLETLVMSSLPKLKGWWKDDISSCSLLDRSGQDIIPSFPRLHTLRVERCPNMTSFPGCQHSHLKRVTLLGVDGLKFWKKTEAASESQQSCVGVSCSSSSSSKAVVSSNNVGLSRSIDIDNNHHSDGYDLDELIIDNIELLNSLLTESRRVRTLQLWNSDFKRLSDARIEHLTNELQHLKIDGCENIEMEEEGDGMMPWKALHSLTILELYALPKMVNLPKGIQYLTSLQSLSIHYCDNLEALPEWLDSLPSLQLLRLIICPKFKSFPEAIRRLPSLTELEIEWCDDSLVKRCTEPDGEDWPKIRHIPILKIHKFPPLSIRPSPPHQSTD